MSATAAPLSHEPESAPLLGAIVKGIYRLERLLGVGGMGAVYEATDRAGQKFAVKFVHASLSQSGEHEQRFLREARIGESIASRHVVPVVDGGRDVNGLFLVMPLLQGHDLAGLLERIGPLAQDVAVRLILQACDGLSAAHRAGVVHRDIKPSNLFLHYQPDGEVVVRVADFGIAKRTDMYDDSNLTRTGASLGSPLYMSPEQVLSAKTVDVRTDIWSLAATLYEVLSGTTPHGDAISLGELMVRITSNNCPSIQSRAPWVSPNLALAIHQALHRQPSGRFETIDAFAGALRSTGVAELKVHASELRPIADGERAIVAQVAGVESVSCPETVGSGQVLSSGPGDKLIGRVLGKRYRVLRLLGRGGMGNVYEAEQANGGRVAVKVISAPAAGDNLESARRFLREAEASRAIDSPHVVRTLDVGTDETTGLPFIVMELLRGVDLAVLLKRQGALLPAVLVRVLIQAARGVAAAHTCGVVHRDIKPANLFLSVQPGDPHVTVKVCDFGVAKRLFDEASDQATHELTRTGGMLGSPMYMSPEQAQSAKHVDHRTDIWSLGISLFEGLSCRRPWDDKTALGQIIVAICTAPVPPLQQFAPWVEPGLAETVHLALAKDPDQRLSSAAEFIARLEPHAGGSTEILRDELRGVDLSTRSRIAPKANIAGASTSEGQARTVDQAAEARGKKRGAMALAVVGLAIVGIVGVASYRLKTGQARIEEVVALPPSKPVPPKVARLRIAPIDAQATVEGRKVDVTAGEIEIQGQPGDSFAVVITKDSRTRTATVVLAKDGTLNPKSIALEPPPAASAVAPAAPPHAERRIAAARSDKPAADPAKAAAPAPAGDTKPTPAAPAAPHGVVPVQEW